MFQPLPLFFQLSDAVGAPSRASDAVTFFLRLGVEGDAASLAAIVRVCLAARREEEAPHRSQFDLHARLDGASGSIQTNQRVEHRIFLSTSVLVLNLIRVSAIAHALTPPWLGLPCFQVAEASVPIASACPL